LSHEYEFSLVRIESYEIGNEKLNTKESQTIKA